MKYLFSLLLATPYYFTVAAVNELGRGPFSQQSLITTNSTSKSYTTVPDLQKPDIMTNFWKSDFCISEFYIPKALFYSNINVLLQTIF